MNTKVIFDLDGTLIDSRSQISETYLKVFDKIKPTKSNFSINRVNFTSSLFQVLSYAYDDTIDIQKAKLLFSNIYDNSNFESTLLYEDVYYCLEDLFNKGFEMFVATNKRLIPTLKILNIKKIDTFFKDVISTDSFENFSLSKQEMVKKLCDRNNILSGVMVGDSSGDIIAGKESNLEQIAVLYGYEQKEVLIEKKPIFVANNFRDVYNIILQYGS